MPPEREARQHVDRSQLGLGLEALPAPGDWRARLWDGVCRWWREGITVEPRDGRPDVTRRLEIERAALKAATRMRKREEDDVIEIVYHTLRLLGLERRVHFRRGGTPRPR